MALQKLTGDLNVIARLSDTPNDVDGLSAQELKAMFDVAGLTIQRFINNTLIPALDAADVSVRSDLQQYVNQVASNFTAGLLSPGSVTNAMLATPIYKTVVYFNADSWAASGTEYAMTIPYDQHNVAVPATASITHNIDNTYHDNTMAVQSTCIRRDASNNLILQSDAAYAGRLVLIS